jgi:hypothetical protein
LFFWLLRQVADMPIVPLRLNKHSGLGQPACRDAAEDCVVTDRNAPENNP